MRKLLLAFVLVAAGCVSTSQPALDYPEQDFSVGGQRYKLTREQTDAGEGQWLLWREEGISWRLVAARSAP